MAEIFLSYASQDRERIRPLVEALEADGFDVWWDRNIQPGPSFDREIEQAIEASRCVVVAWSAHSVESEWVRSEVEEGARRGILIPLLLDDVMPPLAHRRRQAADLSAWDGRRDDEYDKLVGAIRGTIAQDDSTADAPAALPAAHAGRRRRGRRRSLGWGGVAALSLLTLVLGSAATWLAVSSGAVLPESLATAERERTARRFVIDLPDEWVLSSSISPLTITADGTHLVMNVQRGSEFGYLSRSLASIEATLVPEVEGAGSIFPGPEGKLIFNHERTPEGADLGRFRVPEGGSESVATLADVVALGLSISPLGPIAIGSRDQGLRVLDPATGIVETVAPDAKDTYHLFPFWFDDGNKLLYVEMPTDAADMADRGTIRVLDLETGGDRALLPGTQPIVTASGHLVFRHNGYVWATAFDATLAEAYGERIRLFESTAQRFGYRGLPYSVSADGTLVYALSQGGADEIDGEWGWLDFEGQFEAVELPLPDPVVPRLAEEDRVVLLVHNGAGGTDIWRHDLVQGRTSRVWFSDVVSGTTAWFPDDTHVAYVLEDALAAGDRWDLHVLNANGTNQSRRLTEGWQAMMPSVAPDGEAVVFETCRKGLARCDLARIALDEGATPELIVSGDAHYEDPVISHDGRWLAYASDESGRTEIYVRPWPDVGSGRWQVSVDGGWLPFWARGDDRLFFVDPDDDMLMATSIEAASAFASTRPEALIDLSGYSLARVPEVAVRNFDVDSAGQRLFISSRSSRQNRVVVVVDWFEELERLAPTLD